MIALPQRFWDKVQRGAADECWPWTGSRDEKGYGLFRYSGRLVRASRLVVLAAGEPMTGRVARHTCDSPPCTNPAHLIAGTQRQNIADCAARRRRARSHGEHNNAAKLTDDRVRAIRREFAALRKSPRGYCDDGVAQALARANGITYRNLKFIVNRDTWSHVGD